MDFDGGDLLKGFMSLEFENYPCSCQMMEVFQK